MATDDHDHDDGVDVDDDADNDAVHLDDVVEEGKGDDGDDVTEAIPDASLGKHASTCFSTTNFNILFVFFYFL